jgi:hypothetical protein
MLRIAAAHAHKSEKPAGIAACLDGWTNGISVTVPMPATIARA